VFLHHVSGPLAPDVPAPTQTPPGLVVVIDLKTNTTLTAIPTVGPEPFGIAVTPDDDP